MEEEKGAKSGMPSFAAALPFARLPLRKLLRFAAVGFSLMGLHIGLGFLLIRFAGLDDLVASLLAYAGAASVGYWSQRIVTFRSYTPHRSSVPRFLAMLALGGAVSFLASLLATDWLRIDALYGIVAAAMLTPVANYLIMDRLVFPDQR
jgi:putative flippase GtrA